MSDERLRALERAASAGGWPEQRALLVEQHRLGCAACAEPRPFFLPAHHLIVVARSHGLIASFAEELAAIARPLFPPVDLLPFDSDDSWAYRPRPVMPDVVPCAGSRGDPTVIRGCSPAISAAVAIGPFGPREAPLWSYVQFAGIREWHLPPELKAWQVEHSMEPWPTGSMGRPHPAPHEPYYGPGAW